MAITYIVFIIICGKHILEIFRNSITNQRETHKGARADWTSVLTWDGFSPHN
jgi:hypothetical protein